MFLSSIKDKKMESYSHYVSFYHIRIVLLQSGKTAKQRFPSTV